MAAALLMAFATHVPSQVQECYRDTDKAHVIAGANFGVEFCDNEWTAARFDLEDAAGNPAGSLGEWARGTHGFVAFSRPSPLLPPPQISYATIKYVIKCPDGDGDGGSTSVGFFANRVRLSPLFSETFTGHGSDEAATLFNPETGIFSCPSASAMTFVGLQIPPPAVTMTVNNARMGIINPNQQLPFRVSTRASGGSVVINDSSLVGMWDFGHGPIEVNDTVIDKAFFVGDPNEGFPTGEVIFRDCVFKNPVVINFGRPVTFVRCEFLGSPLSVRIDPPENKVFRDSVFAGTLEIGYWATAANLAGLEITRCSFLGEQAVYAYAGAALLAPKIPLTQCFFGEDRSPLEGVEHRFFLGNRTASVDGNLFDVFQRQPAGSFPTHPSYEPRVWMIGWTAGQNTMWHHPPWGGTLLPGILKHRETLVAVDLACSAPFVDGVVVHAEVEGVRYSSTPLRVFRDLKSAGSVYEGAVTANVILPPMETAGSKTLTLILDTTSASPAVVNPPEQTLSGNRTIPFEQSYQRPLNVEVYPVRVHLSEGSLTTYSRTASALGVIGRGWLEDIPSKLPLARNDIVVTLRPTITYTGKPLDRGTTRMLNGITGILAVSEYLADVIMSPGSGGIDLVTAVVPTGAMGNSTDGAVQGFRSGLIFVDENVPTAIAHELGHVFGLHTLLEQYNDPRYWGLGIHVEGHTGFLPEASLNTLRHGERILHFAKPGGSWYRDPFTYDFMGAVVPTWPIESSYRRFASGLRSWLDSPFLGVEAPASEARQAHRSQRKLFFQAMVDRQPNGTYRIDPSSAYAFDVTAYPGERYEGGMPIGHQYIWHYDTATTIGHEIGYVILDGRPRIHPETGQIIYSHSYPIALTQVYPETATRVYLRQRLAPQEIAFELIPGEIEAPTHLSPPPGTDIGESLSVSWTPASPVDSVGQPVRHMVMWSEDGVDWCPIGLPDTGSSLVDLPSDFLPVGDDLRLRVVASNGFTSQTAEVGGLQVVDRPPLLEVLSPRQNEEALPDVIWPMRATAFDIEDQSVQQIVWESSRDGLLGLGGSITTTLSEGTHSISCSASDTAGNTTLRTLSVWVGDMETIDLALDQDSLSVRPQGLDMNTTLIPHYDGATSATLVFRLRNQGCPTRAILSLSAIPPNGIATQLIAEEEVSLSPFEEAALMGAFLPTTAGQWRIEAKVQSIDPMDRDPANNVVYETLVVERIGNTLVIF